MRGGVSIDSRYQATPEAAAALAIASVVSDPAVTPRAEQVAIGTRILQRLIANGLPFREGSDGRHVDLFAALDYMKASRDDAWRNGLLPEVRRAAMTFQAAMERHERGEESRARLVLHHRRRWHFVDRAVGSRLRLAFSLPIDDDLRTTVSVSVTDAGGCAATVTSDAVTLRTTVPDAHFVDAEIRIESILDCQIPRADPRLVAPDVAPWLAMDELAVSERAVTLARDCASRFDQPIDRIRAIWDELGARLRSGWIHPEDKDIDPLELGWVDCQSATTLLTAMCRSVGVPARRLSGMLVYPARTTDFHFWMEAWIPTLGWAPFDWNDSFTCAELPDDRASWQYLRFGRIDHRLISTRYPARGFATTGAEPRTSWYRIDRVDGDTRTAEYYGRDDRRPLYTDSFRVELGWL